MLNPERYKHEYSALRDSKLKNREVKDSIGGDEDSSALANSIRGYHDKIVDRCEKLGIKITKKGSYVIYEGKVDNISFVFTESSYQWTNLKKCSYLIINNKEIDLYKSYCGYGLSDFTDLDILTFLDDVILNQSSRLKIITRAGEELDINAEKENQFGGYKRVLKKELDNIQKELEKDTITRGRRDYLEEQRDYITYRLSTLKDSLIKDGRLKPSEKGIFAKRILNVNSNKELLDILYEFINYDGKLFDKAMDIYERESPVSYKAKKISDLLLNTSIKDAGWYSIEHITVESVNDITLKNIVNTVKKVVRTEVKKIINGALENNILTLRVYAKNNMNKKFTWMELPLEFNLDVERYYKGNKFDNITYYKDMSSIKNKLKTYTNKTLYEAKSLITDKNL